MAAAGQDSPPRDYKCAEIPATPGGSTRGRLQMSSAHKVHIPGDPASTPKLPYLCSPRSPWSPCSLHLASSTPNQQ